jgi:RNA polymerase sigma factor (sigma-70 family)
VSSTDAAFSERLAAARDGDATAWTDLYHEVAPLLIGYLRAQRLPDPEDVAGEVMLEVVRDLDRFDGDRANFRSWVLAIAHHRLLDARRRDGRRPSTPTAPAELTPSPASVSASGSSLAELGLGELEDALQALTEEQRTVLLLRVIGDLSIAEVARITGKRGGAVKQLQRRAVEAMRRVLDEAPPTVVVGDQRTTRVSRVARSASSPGGSP